MTKLVCGVGVNDGKYPAKVNGKNVEVYGIWRRALKRCYSPEYQRQNPTYLGCSASENFKNYSYFHEWCENQVGFGQQDFQLDKDLIFKGNKLYSEDTCLFLPKQLNIMLISRKASRGTLPIGVTAGGGKFMAKCGRGFFTSRYIGVFNTPEEAFHAYKQVKEAFIKAQAEKWKALIDPRAYAALMAYEVEITD